MLIALNGTRHGATNTLEENGDPTDAYGGFNKYESLTLHGVTLRENGSTWTAVIKGVGLSSIIDAAQYNANSGDINPPSNETADLASIVGYDSTSTLSISVQ